MFDLNTLQRFVKPQPQQQQQQHSPQARQPQNTQPTQKLSQTTAVNPFAAVGAISAEQAMANNPFMGAVTPSVSKANADFGQNQPLKKAMFLGYWNDKPLYGGSRLFIQY